MKSEKKTKTGMRLAVVLLAAVASAAIGARGQSQQVRGSNPGTGSSTAAAVKTPAGAVVQPAASYEIGAGDVLAVNVWREKEMTEKILVRPDGMITVPLIGDVHANGRTPEGLATEISEKLKGYLSDPRVTVIVLEVHSKWFMVMGEVSKPGRFPLVRPITVMEALSQAGSFREFAKPNKIYILREVNGKTVRLPFHYKKVAKGRNLSENIELHNGDTIVVP